MLFIRSCSCCSYLSMVDTRSDQGRSKRIAGVVETRDLAPVIVKGGVEAVLGAR